MNNIIKNRKSFFIGIVIIVIFLLTIILSKINMNNKEDNKSYLEVYESNQYVPVKVTESDMAVKYLNDYKNLLLNDLSQAYNLLNKSYKEAKFGSYDNFALYVKNNLLSLKMYSVEIEKYSVLGLGEKKVYSIYDTSGNQFIFKENSIMNYEVYFDDNTVEIK